MNVEVTVHEVVPTTRYRTHIRGVANEAGQFGIYASRSHDIIPISDCLIAGEELHVEQIATEKFEPMEPIEVPQGDQIREVKGKKLKVKAGAFWQRHRNAPDILTTKFLELAKLKAGEHLLDLYGGVGLFSSVAIDVLGPGGRIDLIESSIPAIDSARENFADYPNIKIIRNDVAKALKNIKRADVVVLDPPRAGAGASGRWPGRVAEATGGCARAARAVASHRRLDPGVLPARLAGPTAAREMSNYGGGN